MKFPILKIIRVALWTVITVLISSCAANHPPQTSDDYPTFADSEPEPELVPAKVVEIQMMSLQENRDDDHGIDVAYRFASPKNRESIGSRENFAGMLRSDRYAPMLNSRSFEVRQIEANQQIAYVAVRIEGGDGEIAGYIFILSRQMGGDFDRCWMTEGVLQVPVPPDSSPLLLEPPNETSL